MNRFYNTLSRKYIRLLFVIFFLLSLAFLSSTIVIFNIHSRDRERHDFMVWQVQETQKTLQSLYFSLARGDMKRSFAELEQAQKRVTDALASMKEAPPGSLIAQQKIPDPEAVTAAPAAASPAPQTAAVPAPAAQAVPPPTVAAAKAPPAVTLTPAALSIPAGNSPYPLLIADAGEYLLACEKDRKTLHLFRQGGQGFSLVKSYACIIGANSLDKLREGDLATPVGNYFTLRFIPDQALPEEYGYGAFVLNYPNFLDRKARKDGTGIWLHGHTPGMNLGGPELQSTRGCIAVSNEDLKELKGLIKASGTPVVVVNTLQYSPTAQQKQLAAEIMDFMQSWSTAWESRSADPFMKHYSADFISADGMNYQAFKRQKEQVNKSKKFIEVRIEDMAALLPQEQEGQIAVARFMQRYRSSNFNSDTCKLFYLRKGPEGWQIIGESIW